MESPITILQILLHQELTRERDRSPHVHQGKISNNFLTKLSFYYAIIGVWVFRFTYFFFIHCASFPILLGRKEKLCVCCLGPALIYRSVLTLILTSFFPFLAQYTLSWSFTCSFYWFLTSILAKIYYAYYDRHREEREIQELLGQLDAAIHARDHALRKWPLMVKQVH